jgi:hypothetical protein
MRCPICGDRDGESCGCNPRLSRQQRQPRQQQQAAASTGLSQKASGSISRDQLAGSATSRPEEGRQASSRSGVTERQQATRDPQAPRSGSNQRQKAQEAGGIGAYNSTSTAKTQPKPGLADPTRTQRIPFRQAPLSRPYTTKAGNTHIPGTGPLKRDKIEQSLALRRSDNVKMDFYILTVIMFAPKYRSQLRDSMESFVTSIAEHHNGQVPAQHPRMLGGFDTETRYDKEKWLLYACEEGGRVPTMLSESM